MTRRDFITTAITGATSFPLFGLAAPHGDPLGQLPAFVQRKDLPDDVVIDSLTLLERDGNWFVRAQSKDGAEGWAVGHPSKTQLCAPVFRHVVAKYLRGKDARDLDQLVDGVYLSGSNYKMQGQLFWVAVAAAEFALLDLLGHVAKQSAAEFVGRCEEKADPTLHREQPSASRPKGIVEAHRCFGRDNQR